MAVAKAEYNRLFSEEKELSAFELFFSEKNRPIESIGTLGGVAIGFWRALV